MRRRLLIAALVACSLAPSGFAAQAAPQSNGADRYALVVGISDYPGTLLDLPLVAQDVASVTAMLTGHFGFAPENIRVLESEQATRQAILDGITGFLGQAQPSDLAMFYYSGHGTRTEENVAVGAPLDPEADGQDEALVTYDELLVDDELAFALQSVAAGRLLVLFDSCHSGDATRADLSVGQPKSADIAQVSKFIELPEHFRIPPTGSLENADAAGGMLDISAEGRLFVAASDESELSWVAPNLGQSLFTYFLTDRMATAGDKTFEELMSEVSPRVNQYAQQYFQVPQSTHLEGSEATARTQIGEFFKVDASP